MATAGVENAGLEAAFATIPREDFLGPGPWLAVSRHGYHPTPDADPVHLYADALFALVPERRLNNGEPSSHAFWIASAAPQSGEHIVHIGAGTGYYSAILAHMAGPSGRLTAIEYDPALAARAAANLAPFPTVTVLQGDGTTLGFRPALT